MIDPGKDLLSGAPLSRDTDEPPEYVVPEDEPDDWPTDDWEGLAEWLDEPLSVPAPRVVKRHRYFVPLGLALALLLSALGIIADSTVYGSSGTENAGIVFDVPGGCIGYEWRGEPGMFGYLPYVIAGVPGQCE